ncbi:MAG: site-specific DNA-methyltransferase [Actinobacteria bacterium]|nr:site-specific DNA-methyltransferase [Actinomycetota bacterium]
MLDRIQSSDWDCLDCDTQYLTHAIHRYSGKFIPQIARQAIEILTEPGDKVLDPYCGSGTTLLECALLSRHSIGIDLSPLAVMISRVKTTPVGHAILEDLLERQMNALDPLLQRSQPSLFTNSHDNLGLMSEKVIGDWRWTDPWYVKWFFDSPRFELIAIHQVVMSEPDPLCRDVLLVAFSDILRSSSRAHGGYPNVMFDKRKSESSPVTARYLARLAEIIRSIDTLDGAFDKEYQPEVLLGDAQSIPMSDATVDAVITHPPYVGSIPYAEYGVLSLVWLGYDPRELDRILTGGKRQTKDVVDRFRNGFDRMISESHRVLKPNKMMFMLLGNPTVKGQVIDLTEMAIAIATGIGFSVYAVQVRRGKNRRANLMGHESLLFLRK